MLRIARRHLLIPHVQWQVGGGNIFDCEVTVNRAVFGSVSQLVPTDDSLGLADGDSGADVLEAVRRGLIFLELFDRRPVDFPEHELVTRVDHHLE